MIHTSSEFEIALFSFQGERVGTIRDTVAPEKVTATHTRRWINEKVGRATGDNARREIRRFFEALEYPDAFPAHGKLIVDPFDNLWVQEYLPPGEQVQTWRVYSPQGMRITRVRAPRGFRLLEAGADYVLGVRRNELDVPFVEVYSLIKSTRN